MKIYNKNTNIIGNNSDQYTIEITESDLEESNESVMGIVKFYKDEVEENCWDNGVIKANKEFIIAVLAAYHNCHKNLLHYVKMATSKEPSLTDIKVQIRALVRSKIHRAEQNEYLKDINELLKELE
jgi:hypothetical protein